MTTFSGINNPKFQMWSRKVTAALHKQGRGTVITWVDFMDDEEALRRCQANEDPQELARQFTETARAEDIGPAPRRSSYNR